LPGSDVTLEDVGFNPTRIGFLSVLKRAGAQIDVADGPAVGDEPIGALRIRHGGVNAVEIGPAEVPGTIDELPVLAALAMAVAIAALGARGPSEIRHADVVDVSYPGFFDILTRISAH
jgi:3-phosphoshikimate 1-carboxyvinyltransferase